MDGSIPLSFPAILRNPGYSYLAESGAPQAIVAPKKIKSTRRVDNEGKRWIRRKENARFTGNTHIVQPSRLDLLAPTGQPPRPTFPSPLPRHLSRENKIPSAVLPHRDASADCGRYSLSLKGMRRSLRGMSFRSQSLVRDIETEIVGWIAAGGSIVFADVKNTIETPIGSTGIIEVSRTPLQLVWKASEDPFVRYVVHCTARYHKVVSYSKEVSGERLTYLLRPNVAMPEFRANTGIDTPPATDLDLSSQLDSESDMASERDTRSEIDDVDQMSTIQEDGAAATDDEWSVVGEDMTQSIESLDPDATFVVERQFEAMSLRSRATLPHIRSASSPSRSPIRPPPQRRRLALPATPVSFYDFLFSC